jgi:DNA-3-methyladenine glycosylase
MEPIGEQNSILAGKRLDRIFFEQDVLEVAPAILGKKIVRKFETGSMQQFTITEVEAYRGEEDLACHVSKGKTKRNQVMYEKGGLIYVYLVYGMHWMLNFVTAPKGIPQAILIRGVGAVTGPGRVTKLLQTGKDFYGEDLCISNKIWVLNNSGIKDFITKPRIGIDYAGDFWRNKPWRFILQP